MSVLNVTEYVESVAEPSARRVIEEDEPLASRGTFSQVDEQSASCGVVEDPSGPRGVV